MDLLDNIIREHESYFPIEAEIGVVNTPSISTIVLIILLILFVLFAVIPAIIKSIKEKKEKENALNNRGENANEKEK